MDEQHVARVGGHVAQVLQQVFFLAPYAQHVHVEFVTEADFLDAAVHNARSGHEQDFRYADVVEVQRLSVAGFLGSMIVQQFQPVVAGQGVDLIEVALDVQDVVCLQDSVRFGRFLRDGFQESVL